jgi:hypothetical protein
MWPGIAYVTGDYDNYQPEYTKIYETSKSTKDHEVEIEARYTGIGAIMNEGGPFPQDTMGTRAQTTYRHREVGLSFQITKIAIADNQYKTAFPQQIKQLKKSLRQTKDILGAGVINLGFDPASLIGDGFPLFSDSHPTDVGPFSNTSTPAQLNEGVLEAAMTQIQGWTDASGRLMQARPEKLLVAPAGQYSACKLLNSAFGPDNSNNAINAVNYLNSMPGGYIVNHYLLNPHAWFILTDIPGMRHFMREPVETDVYSDPYTRNLIVNASERYSFGCGNARAIFGNQGM